MPVYEYECQACRKVIEIMQSISDEPATSCPSCEGSLKKIISMSSFQLKGGGWYSDGYSSSDNKSSCEKKTSCPNSDNTSCGSC